MENREDGVPTCAGHNGAHTPGLWEYNTPNKFKQVHGSFADVAVYAPGNCFPWRMAEVQAPDEATAIANARLIAAAPTMLSELKRDLAFAHEMKGLIEALKGKKWVQHTMVLSRIEMLTAAIAKAEGRTDA